MIRGVSWSGIGSRCRWLAVVCAVALVASACGGEGDGGDDRGGAVAETTPVATQGAPDGEQGTDAREDDPAGPDEPAGPDDSAGPDEQSSPDEGSAAVAAVPTDPNVEAPLAVDDSIYGGTLVFALESETTGGWNPITASAATSGNIVLRQLYDPLVIEGADGEPIPFLLESFSPNEDFTEWTFTLRPGITFHDGTPVNSAALIRHFEELEAGALSRMVVAEASIQSFGAVDDLTAKVNLGRGFVDFPLAFTSAVGLLGAPAMHDLGTESARNPIGTGPFKLDEWVEHETTRLVRNPDYWRTDAEGRQLPYLDAIEFRPIEDDDARYNTLRAGDVDASLDNGGRRVEEYNEGFKTYWQDEQYSATINVLLNTSRPPFDNVEFRRALAQCTDRQTLNAVLWDGQPPATGPFSPGTPGYLEDSGFPDYDPEAGRAVIERLGSPSFDITTTVTTLDLLQAELLVQMWGECGLDVGINQMLQAEAVTTAVFGNFSVSISVNHSGYSLALERFWWHSGYSPPLPVPALNFGRFSDARIDAALDEAIATADKERKRELAEEVNRAFADGVYNIWLYHSRWLTAAHDYVNGVDNLTLPNGGEHLKIFLGRVFLAETWLER